MSYLAVWRSEAERSLAAIMWCQENYTGFMFNSKQRNSVENTRGSNSRQGPPKPKRLRRRIQLTTFSGYLCKIHWINNQDWATCRVSFR